MSDKPEKEKIKILAPLVSYSCAIAIGVFLTLAYMRCTYSDGSEILACDMSSFSFEVPQ